MLSRTVSMLQRGYNENGSKWDFQESSRTPIQTSASAIRSGAMEDTIVRSVSQNHVSFQPIAKYAVAQWFRRRILQDAITTSSLFLALMKSMMKKIVIVGSVTASAATLS
mmetsp:Transcript_28413/g.55278  ORF Transcript_28413/g.55278 Transcript_28413/m.55278 type:complete len:110 (+) Transcript_28413:759-1088(+)